VLKTGIHSRSWLCLLSYSETHAAAHCDRTTSPNLSSARSIGECTRELNANGDFDTPKSDSPDASNVARAPGVATILSRLTPLSCDPGSALKSQIGALDQPPQHWREIWRLIERMSAEDFCAFFIQGAEGLMHLRYCFPHLAYSFADE
jgi:hypothetical protein